MSALLRWDPLREIATLQRSAARFWDGLPSAEGRPAVDVYETAEAVVVRADLPGVAADQIEVQFEDGWLTLRATRQPAVPDGATWHLRGVREAEAVRVIAIERPVSAEGAEASYTGGVLQVRLPKTEAAKAKQIPVQAG